MTMPMTSERAAQLVHDTVAKQARIGHPVTIIMVHPIYYEMVKPAADQHGLHIFCEREAPMDRFLFR